MKSSWFSYLKQGLSRKMPKDRIAGERGYSDLLANLKNLRPFLARHWGKGLLGVILIILTSLLAFPQPLILRYIVDHVILAKNLNLLVGAILLMAGVKLAEMLMSSLEQFYFARFEQVVTLDIQHDLLDRTLRYPKSFFDANQTGYLMSRLSSDVEGMGWFFSSTIVYIVSNIVRFAGGVALLFYLEWRLALVVLVMLPGIVLSVRYFAKKIHILSHQSLEQRATVSTHLQESLSSMPLIKAFSSEDRTVKRLMSRLKAAFQISLEQSSVSSAADLVINSMPGIARVTVLAAGAFWVIKGQWSLGSLLAFQAYLGYVFGPAQFLAAANLQLQNARAALERVSALFSIVPEENMGTGKTVKKLKGEIEFKNVSFSYDGREQVLRDVSFRINPKDHVAIVGPSGVGKTTLLSLILHFYKPAQGKIYFDGQPASEFEVGSLRSRIGYVSQSTLLLSGTILENLRYGNPEASQEQLVQAARAAGIHEFIAKLPAGYETEIGEKGVKLSEGQKQRLAIARALVKDPDILVLDEPTSSLDRVTEKSILEALPTLAQDKTLFVVANRLSTVERLNRVLLLDENGQITVGSHLSLLKTNDYYRMLLGHR